MATIKSPPIVPSPGVSSLSKRALHGLPKRVMQFEVRTSNVLAQLRNGLEKISKL